MNSSRLELNSDIYDMDSVKYSAEKYSGIANIDISQKDGYIICEFSECKNGTERTVREFENYVIYVSNTVKHYDNS